VQDRQQVFRFIFTGHGTPPVFDHRLLAATRPSGS
jgi:hypothetical protein